MMELTCEPAYQFKKGLSSCRVLALGKSIDSAARQVKRDKSCQKCDGMQPSLVQVETLHQAQRLQMTRKFRIVDASLTAGVCRS